MTDPKHINPKTIEDLREAIKSHMKHAVNHAYEVMDSKSFADPFTEDVDAILADLSTIVRDIIADCDKNGCKNIEAHQDKRLDWWKGYNQCREEIRLKAKEHGLEL